MCSTRQVIDPGGLLFGDKTSKYADPLGITKTAVGDPTGRIRKERAKVEAENRPWKSNTILGYESLQPGNSKTVLGG